MVLNDRGTVIIRIIGGLKEMSVNGIGAGSPAWYEAKRTQRNNSGTGFASKMDSADTAGSVLSQRASVGTSALDAYHASVASAVRNVKPAYETVFDFGAWNHEL